MGQVMTIETSEAGRRFADALRAERVVPVLTIERWTDAVPLARALVAGGLTHLEITLRTAAALEAIRAVAGEVSVATVGAGTVLTPRQAESALAAGAEFLVSPGATGELFDAAGGWPAVWLPGVATASEGMRAMERGLGFVNFFPAEAAGGVGMLKALAAPLAGLKLCPTGGVSLHNAAGYLACSNVVCVGGSWVAPTKMVAEGAWAEISQLAAEARQIAV